MSMLPSIYEIENYEIGGRVARVGFLYQDHVGVKYLLRMLNHPINYDIFFETEDDIVCVENDGKTTTVEMIQVKSNDLSSRWSVSKIIDLEVLQKSLERGECEENVKYKIVTLCDVDNELEILKCEIGSKDREQAKIDALIKAIKKKKSNIPNNKKGQNVDYWVSNCLWEKLADSIDAIQSQNQLLLEEAIFQTRNFQLYPDQRIELYQKILAFVQEFSSIRKKQKIDKAFFENWLDEKLTNFSPPIRGNERLIQKMQEANIDSTLIAAAKELKWMFIQESLNHQFVSANSITRLQSDLLNQLIDLKLKIDDESIKLDGPQFHTLCSQKASELALKYQIDEAISKGCMYEITKRCLHRFVKATP